MQCLQENTLARFSFFNKVAGPRLIFGWALHRTFTVWNNKFEFPAGYIKYLIQDYFEYLLKKHGENIDNLSIRVYANNKENRTTFKIKTEYYLELLTMKLLGSTENKITKNQK